MMITSAVGTCDSVHTRDATPRPLRDSNDAGWCGCCDSVVVSVGDNAADFFLLSLLSAADAAAVMLGSLHV